MRSVIVSTRRSPHRPGRAPASRCRPRCAPSCAPDKSAWPARSARRVCAVRAHRHRRRRFRSSSGPAARRMFFDADLYRDRHRSIIADAHRDDVFDAPAGRGEAKQRQPHAGVSEGGSKGRQRQPERAARTLRADRRPRASRAARDRSRRRRRDRPRSPAAATERKGAPYSAPKAASADHADDEGDAQPLPTRRQGRRASRPASGRSASAGRAAARSGSAPC